MLVKGKVMTTLLVLVFSLQVMKEEKTVDLAIISHRLELNLTRGGKAIEMIAPFAEVRAFDGLKFTVY